MILGILGIVWYVFWLLLVFDSPAKHPRISKSEREYIESGIPEPDKKVYPPTTFKLTLIP